MSGNLKQIKRRIKSAKNIGQITKAMEMVAASKMRKAQKKAVQSKPYSDKIFEATLSLMEKVDPKLHPLLKTPKKDNRPLVVFISTNRGLCGSLNLNLFRRLSKFIAKRKQKKTVTFDYAILGKKGLKFITNLGGGFYADFSDLVPFTQAVGPIISAVSRRFLKNRNTSVWLVYNTFINALKQKPTIKRILPLTGLKVKPKKEDQAVDKVREYLIEPSPNRVIKMLLPFYLESQVREAVFQAEASEFSARMIAMKNATDNAHELVDGLTLEYNKARQRAITLEIADMVTSKISMEKND